MSNLIQRLMAQANCEANEVADLLNEAAEALAQQQGSVTLPATADEAALMVLTGTAWLKYNAPERLTHPAPAREPLFGEMIAQHPGLAEELRAMGGEPAQQPLTDEQERALCEAYCNTASDEYFKARPQLESDVNRRIFYAGHRKAFLRFRDCVHHHFVSDR